MTEFKCRYGDPRCVDDPCPAGIRWLCETRDSDRSGEAGETRSGSTEGESAGRDSGIAQTPSEAK